MDDPAQHVPPLNRTLQHSLLCCHRAVLAQTLMRPRLIELRRILGQHAVQMSLIQNEQLI